MALTQTITLATKHNKLLKVKKSDPRFEAFTKTSLSTVKLYSN